MKVITRAFITCLIAIFLLNAFAQDRTTHNMAIGKLSFVKEGHFIVEDMLRSCEEGPTLNDCVEEKRKLAEEMIANPEYTTFAKRLRRVVISSKQNNLDREHSEDDDIVIDVMLAKHAKGPYRLFIRVQGEIYDPSQDATTKFVFSNGDVCLLNDNAHRISSLLNSLIGWTTNELEGTLKRPLLLPMIFAFEAPPEKPVLVREEVVSVPFHIQVLTMMQEDPFFTNADLL